MEDSKVMKADKNASWKKALAQQPMGDGQKQTQTTENCHNIFQNNLLVLHRYSLFRSLKKLLPGGISFLTTYNDTLSNAFFREAALSYYYAHCLPRSG